MTRLAAIALLVLVTTGVATAAPTRKVLVETVPTGATVFIGDKESGAVCTTPCTLPLPIGDTLLIIELAGHVSEFENVTVAKAKRGDRKPMVVRYKLVAAVGTLVIGAVPGSPGAAIKIDSDDKGPAPARIDVEAGAHQVQVLVGTRVAFDDFVTVDAGAETAITPKAVGKGSGGTDKKPPRSTVLPTDPVDPEPAIPLPPPALTLAVTADSTFRHFSYSGGSGGLEGYRQNGQLSFGVDGDLSPFPRLGHPALAPFSLHAHVSVYSVAQTLSNTDVALTTFWRTYSASLRYRREVLGWLTLGASVGYELDEYQFSGESTQIPRVPDARYSGIPVGAFVGISAGAFLPYLTYDHDFMLSARLIDSTFSSTSARADRGALGVTARFKHFYARAEGAIEQYSWTLSGNPAATTATDSVEDVTLSVGGSY